MNNSKFVNIAKEISNSNTRYQLGGWGNQDNGVYLFDCVCLLKSILWGFDFERGSHGGAIYESNNVPDIGADEMINRCNDISTDFNNIEIGEAVWLDGHIGIYAGNREVVEATSAWEGKVVISNIGPNGERIRNNHQVYNWTKHGKLPYVSYEIDKVKILSFNVNNIESRKVTVSFNTDKSVDWAKYSINNQDYIDLPTTNVIDNLLPNHTYNIKIELRRTGTNNWTESNIIAITTKDELIDLKYKVGDKIMLNGTLYSEATINGIKGITLTNHIDNITLIYDHYDSVHPYNIGVNYLGWVDEKDLTLYIPVESNNKIVDNPQINSNDTIQEHTNLNNVIIIILKKIVKFIINIFNKKL